MVPRRAVAAYQRVRATLGGQMAAFGIEPTHANVMAAMVEILDQQLHPDRAVPCMDPNAPIYEAPDGGGIEVAGGYIGKRVDPDKPPTVRGVPIRPAPETESDS